MMRLATVCNIFFFLPPATYPPVLTTPEVFLFRFSQERTLVVAQNIKFFTTFTLSYATGGVEAAISSGSGGGAGK
jgi:hypothetical protein